jgi:hypothetical protein
MSFDALAYIFFGGIEALVDWDQPRTRALSRLEWVGSQTTSLRYGEITRTCDKKGLKSVPSRF